MYSRSAKAASESGFKRRIRMPSFSAGHPFISSLKGGARAAQFKPKGNGVGAGANVNGLQKEFQLLPSDSQLRFGSNSTRETSMDNFGQRRRFSQSGMENMSSIRFINCGGCMHMLSKQSLASARCGRCQQAIRPLTSLAPSQGGGTLKKSL